MRKFNPLWLIVWLLVAFVAIKALALSHIPTSWGHVITSTTNLLSQGISYLIMLLLPSPLLKPNNPTPRPAGQCRQGVTMQKVLTFIDRAIILLMALIRWPQNPGQADVVAGDADNLLALAKAPTWCDDVVNGIVSRFSGTIADWIGKIEGSTMVPPPAISIGYKIIMAIEGAIGIVELEQNDATPADKQQAAVTIAQQFLTALPPEVQDFLTPDTLAKMIDNAVADFNNRGVFQHKAPIVETPSQPAAAETSPASENADPTENNSQDPQENKTNPDDSPAEPTDQATESTPEATATPTAPGALFVPATPGQDNN